MQKKSEQNGKAEFNLLCFILRWGNKEVFDLAFYLLRQRPVYKLVMDELLYGDEDSENKKALYELMRIQEKEEPIESCDDTPRWRQS